MYSETTNFVGTFPKKWQTLLAVGVMACTFGYSQSAVAAPEMTDQAITDKIEDELFFDPGVTATGIDVSTTDGIVMLEGEVNNVLAKDRAARIAETVKGVRSVVNQIKVKPSVFRTDTAIRKDVQTALIEDPATDAYELAVAVQAGHVTLKGVVDSYQERILAVKVAKGIRGVKDVEDDIEVSTKSNRADEEIESEIKRLFHWDRFIDDNVIAVAVDDGNVHLSGIVGSAAEKRRTQAQAWVAGVKGVDDSRLKVEIWARDDKLRGKKFALKSAKEIRDAVNDALVYDPRVKAFNVYVDTAGSTVTLRGVVDNLKAKRAAEDVARNTVGVTWVTNRLKVKPVDSWSDDELHEAINLAFGRDMYVERFEISPTVINGTAYLYGTVDTAFEKNRAEQVAEGVQGVVNVKNYLHVDDDVAYVYNPFVDDGYFIEGHSLADYDRRRPYKTDTQLKQDIESELWWSPFVNADQVSVTVDGGVATLSGTVDSWGERQSATENAYEGGATLVDNDIQVEYEQ